MRKSIRILGFGSLICILLLLIYRTVSAQGRFEKGDGIYRYGIPPALTFLVGHAGLYSHWEGEDPEDDTTHLTIESLGSIWWWEWSKQGPTVTNYQEFLAGKGADAGVFTMPNIGYKRRQKIVDTAKAQVDDFAHYSFVRGYKNPEPPPGRPKSFRCDGLVEYCYEVALGEPWQPGNNGGIVENDTWRTLWPFRQMGNMVAETAQLEEIAFHKSGIIEEGEAITPKIKYEDSKYYIKNTVDINFYASDGDKGSGLTRAELWLEKSDGTIVEIDRDNSNYDVYHFYTTSFDTTTVPNTELNKEDTLYAKAFDQAGNYKLTSIPIVIENLVVEKILEWTGYDVLLKFTKAGTYKIYAKDKKADEEEWKDVDWDLIGEVEIKEDILPCYCDLKLDYPQWVSTDDDALDMKHGVRVTGLASANDVAIWKTYQWKRLIVDTTADWETGELDGITVVDEFHEGSEENPFPLKGYIKPAFGAPSDSIDAGTTGGASYCRTAYGITHLNGDEEHDLQVYADVVDFFATHSWGSCAIGGGWSFTIINEFQANHLWVRSDYSNHSRRRIPAGVKKVGGTYNLGVSTAFGTPASLTYHLQGFSVTVPANSSIQGAIPSNLSGEIYDGWEYFTLSSDPPYAMENHIPPFEVLEWDSGTHSRRVLHYISRSFNVQYLPADAPKGIWSETFSSFTSDKYYSGVIPTNGVQSNVSDPVGEWDGNQWKVTIDFPYEEEVTTWFDRFRYDFKEKKTEPNPA